jgi:hypothetical protein
LSEKFRRVFAMPNSATFSITPVRDLLKWHLQPGWVIIDPFASDSLVASHRNDLRYGGIDAREWLRSLNGISADAVLLDPPYSPRQMKECYESAGIANSGCESTQNARLYKECIALLDDKLKPGGLAIRCGWNSMGFPKDRYERIETLLVNHGGGHNDTIVTVDCKRAPASPASEPGGKGERE